MKFHITDATGHTTEAFDKGDKVSMEAAEARFAQLTGLGFRAAEVTGDGTHTMPPAGKQKFNPDAEDTVFVRPIQGG